MDLVVAVDFAEGCEDGGEGVQKLFLGVGEVLEAAHTGDCPDALPQLLIEVTDIILVEDADPISQMVVVLDSVGLHLDEALRGFPPELQSFEEPAAQFRVHDLLIDKLSPGGPVLHEYAIGLELHNREVLELVL